MNRELIAERCRAGGLSIHEAAQQAWVDPVLMWFDLDDAADDRIPLGTLRVLSRVLDIDWDELVHKRVDPPDAVGDDLIVEAALAEFPDGLSRDDLAALGWSLGRVERALLALEQRLVPTGRRLRLIGWHRYALGPNLAILSAAERARLVRSAAHGRLLPYEVIEALYQIVSGWDRITMFGRGVDRAAVESLIDHGLLEPERVYLKLTADVVFSLRLDEH